MRTAKTLFENGKFKMDLPEPDENWVRPKSEEQFEDEVRNVVDASSSATYPTFELFIDETGNNGCFRCNRRFEIGKTYGV